MFQISDIADERRQSQLLCQICWAVHSYWPHVAVPIKDVFEQADLPFNHHPRSNQDLHRQIFRRLCKPPIGLSRTDGACPAFDDV